MELASSSVAVGGGIGMLIPPGAVFIVYAILTEQSIGELSIAGVLPGLLIALLKCELTWHKLFQCLNESIRTSSMVMVIFAGAIVFGKFLAVTRVPSNLASWLPGLIR
jgi:TRAP-type C4-dicarboxylate transport system permease large subunit